MGIPISFGDYCLRQSILQVRMEFTSHFDQSCHMGYCPPPQNDSSHFSNGGWEYHQRMIEYEQSNKIEHLPKPQNSSYCYDKYRNFGFGRNFNAAYPILQGLSPQNCPTYALPQKLLEFSMTELSKRYLFIAQLSEFLRQNIREVIGDMEISRRNQE